MGNLSLALITATLSFRIYKSVLAAVNKTNEGHPFKVRASDNKQAQQIGPSRLIFAIFIFWELSLCGFLSQIWLCITWLTARQWLSDGKKVFLEKSAHFILNGDIKYFSVSSNSWMLMSLFQLTKSLLSPTPSSPSLTTSFSSSSPFSLWRILWNLSR